MYRLHKPDKDGSTRYQHLKAVEQRTGKTPKELQPPVMAARRYEAAARVYFSVGGRSDGPVQFSELNAAIQYYGLALDGYQKEFILELERAINGTSN